MDANCFSMKRLSAKPIRSLLLLSLVVMLAACGLLFDEVVEGRLVQAVEPVYPVSARDSETEGWVWLNFTVDHRGLVDAASIAVVDEEPPALFTGASVSALKQFKFQPRTVNGVAVTVTDVEYVFRFSL